MNPQQHIINKTCLTKANLTLKQANDIVDKAAKDKLLLFYYKCPFCSSIHLSKKQPSEVNSYLKIA